MNGQVLRNKYEREGDRVPETTRPWDSLPTLKPASPASPCPGLYPSTELCHHSPVLSPHCETQSHPLPLDVPSALR